ncbi:MAG: N-acetyltransferase family protein [Bacteroidia bacterium]
MIRFATELDIDALLVISEQSFGKDFHTKSYFLNAINGKDNKCYVYQEEQDIYGFATVFILEDGYKIDAIAVEKNHREKGIASQLFEEILFDFGDNNIQVLVWRESPEGNLETICERFGFVKKQVFDNYWYRDSVEKAYSCLRCGSPCYCTAILYQK